MSCGVSCRHGSAPTLLWLWCRPDWEHPNAAGAALEKAKRERKKKRYCTEQLEHTLVFSVLLRGIESMLLISTVGLLIQPGMDRFYANYTLIACW